MITQAITIHPVDAEESMTLPLASSDVAAGFPSPADDYLDLAIDLNKELVTNPMATFYARVRGESMKDADIKDGDILVIDRSKKPTHDCVALCILDDEFTVKRLHIQGQQISLVPANSAYSTIHIKEGNNFSVWGVVTYVIHKM